MTSRLASFSIQSESQPAVEPVLLRPGSLSVGRGPLLKVTDRSVSRSHAQLSLDSDTTKLTIRSVHTNPTFVYKIGSDKTVVLNMGQEIELCHADRFSFLPEELFFRVINSNKISSSSEQTLFLPMGNEFNATQPIDGDLVELAETDIDRSETLFLPMGNEFDATQPIDGDLVELADTDIDRSETLFLPMGNEFNATQPIDGDLVELADTDIDRSETLFLPMGNEFDATQPIDGDLVELADTDIDRSETLFLPMGNETDATQPIDGDLVELAETVIDKSETLSEMEREPISNSLDSESSTSKPTPHKKRRLPLWMLEDAKPELPKSKKTKSKTDSPCKGSSLRGDSTELKPLPAVTSENCTSSVNDPTDATASPSLPPDSSTVRLESSVAAVSPISTPKPKPPADRTLPACPYGADCYRKNPTHLESYSHPPKGDTAGHSTATKECPYGSKCYRKNTEHLREFSHPPKGSLARERKSRAAKATKRSVLEGASDDDGAANSYDLKDDFIDNSGSCDESLSTEVESSDSEEWQPTEDVSDLMSEASGFVNNPKMIRK